MAVGHGTRIPWLTYPSEGQAARSTRAPGFDPFSIMPRHGSGLGIQEAKAGPGEEVDLDRVKRWRARPGEEVEQVPLLDMCFGACDHENDHLHQDIHL